MEQNMILTLRTLSFDETGSGQREEITLPARLSLDGNTLRLSYRQEEDGAVAKTAISFDLADPCVVEMEGAGARACFMRFEVGKEHAGEYRLSGLPTFPFRIKTRAVDNKLSADGGRLLLDYEMDFGGARTRMRLTLTAKREGADV
jgi:uncharacterized beta-barrel protein YwiB (DUF1934 family)